MVIHGKSQPDNFICFCGLDSSKSEADRRVSSMIGQNWQASGFINVLAVSKQNSNVRIHGATTEPP